MGHGTFYFILLIISQVEHVHVKHKQQDPPKKPNELVTTPEGLPKSELNRCPVALLNVRM